MAKASKIYQQQIIAASTLVKKQPEPLRKFIGDISRTARILLGLGLTVKTKR